MPLVGSCGGLEAMRIASRRAAFVEALLPGNIRHHFVGQDQAKGVYAKELHVPAGYDIVSHSHSYAHLAILASGSVRWGDRVLIAPCAVTVDAGVEHALHAITDAVWFCIHPTDETDADKVDAVILKQGEV